MKKRLFAGLLCICLLLCGCASEGTIIGVWSGSGAAGIWDADREDEVIPLETWTFREDGTALLEITLDEAQPPVEFTYTHENGILTLRSGDRSVSVPCQQSGDTLVFDYEAEDPAIFTRAG